LRAEFLSNQAPFTNLKVAQQALDEWVDDYDTNRPHQSLKIATPAQRFRAGVPPGPPPQ
jgi:transposase InsO family protein